MAVIKIDHDKCNNAINCRKCLDYCITGVLTAFPKGNPYDHKTVWKISPTLMSLCTGCRNCELNCPEGAINILD